MIYLYIYMNKLIIGKIRMNIIDRIWIKIWQYDDVKSNVPNEYDRLEIQDILESAMAKDIDLYRWVVHVYDLFDDW
jgi:hypothetical protein